MLNQEPFEEIFPEFERRGIRIIIGSPYASGMLTSGSREESKYGYSSVSEEIRKEVQSIEVICEDHGVPHYSSTGSPSSFVSHTRFIDSCSS